MSSLLTIVYACWNVYLRTNFERGIIRNILAYRAGVILASECLVFSWRKLWPPSLTLMAVEGWREKEIFSKGVVDGQK